MLSALGIVAPAGRTSTWFSCILCHGLDPSWEVLAAFFLKVLHELHGGVQMLFHDSQRHANWCFVQGREVISILFGNIQEHFSQGVRSFVDGRRAVEERPRFDIVMSAQKELPPKLDASHFQLLLQFEHFQKYRPGF